MSDLIKDKDIDELAEGVKKLVIELLRKLGEGREPLTIDQTAQLFSKAADDLIINGIQKESLTYVSGKLKVMLSEKLDHYVISMQAYFQKKSGEWIVKSSQSNNLPLYSLTPESQIELKEKKTIEFEIEEPQNKTN